MSTLKRVEAAVVLGEKGLLVALLALMTALAFLQVVLRDLFSSGILWGDILLRHLVLWVGFLGAAQAAVHRRQFSMDALVKRLPPQGGRWVRAAVDLFSSAVCLLLLKAAWAFLRDEHANPSILFNVGKVNVPAWALELILPIGFALLLFHTLLRAAEELTQTARIQAPREGL